MPDTPLPEFVNYSPSSTDYAGADPVVSAELRHLEKTRQTQSDKLSGLALSGGGIRSASFCLGVIQAIASHDKLDQFDYLSTVSGGGYLGGALNWSWLYQWNKNNTCNIKFDQSRDKFPFGDGLRHSNPDTDMDRHQAAMLRHLRQNGKYLTPGNGIDALSFLSVILRSITLGFITLLVLSSFLFHALHAIPGVLQPLYLNTPTLFFFGLALLIFYFSDLIAYAFTAIFYKNSEKKAYQWRHTWEKWISGLLKIALIILLIGLVEIIREQLESYYHSIGGLGAVLGAYVAWKSQTSGNSAFLSKIPRQYVVYMGLLVFATGLLIIADQLAVLVKDIENSLIIHTLLSIGILVSAYIIPVNRVSIHRYYRDRLMETFMPDICDILDPDGTDNHRAESANITKLHECLAQTGNRMPFHIINTNIILVESSIQKFRGRCGDNFILTPLYSGSNATGWRTTRTFADGKITLPTAIAISGAAANSDAGVAGQGMTVNPFISSIMSIFNLRLGYWAVNPNPDYQIDQSKMPNYLRPGFRGSVSRNKLNEEADFIQLSDGGHFENLGLYELIRRKCKTIVCCDAEEDSQFMYESLSNLIEKSRVDFGATINITSKQLEEMKSSMDSNNTIHFAQRGYCIAYINYADGSTGKLIYIKSTLTDELDADIMGYKLKHPAFPHESTIDQFFDEKQFESYRSLGAHIAETMLSDRQSGF